MRKALHFIALTRRCKIALALTQLSKGLHMPANDVFKIDLGARILLIAKDDRRAADVFKARTLDP